MGKTSFNKGVYVKVAVLGNVFIKFYVHQGRMQCQ